jgi:nitroreductase
VLPPEAFRELRLDRNRPRLMAEDMACLSEFTVGIAGLSVGNAIALTLALEGAVGHLRLADFDSLDLSNMNRVRAAVHDIGLPKTLLVARQIAELDPYLGISLLDGIRQDNVGEFLRGGAELGPPLDVLIDECDSLSVKFLLRHEARAAGVPVLMETSDRGMLDVERFDVEPQRPLFHGLAGDTTDVGDGGFSVGDDAARARKAAVAIRLLDAPMISTRLAASFLEIDSTISSWPQLASDVVLGGASVTIAVRRLALGHLLPSGRRYVDLEALVAEVPDTMVPPAPGVTRPEPRPPVGLAHPGRTDEVPELVRYLVEHAVLAPSGGNSQPWHFYWSDDTLWVTLDRDRGQNLADPKDRAVRLALGAAVENIVIAAAARDLIAAVEPFPIPDAPDVVAAITVGPDTNARGTGNPKQTALLRAVLRRRTHRRPGVRAALTSDEAAALTSAGAMHGARLDLCIRPDEMDEIGRILGACDRIRFLNPHLHRELIGELRLDRAGAEHRRDGITVSSLVLPPGPEAAMELITRPDVVARLRHVGGGARLEEVSRDAAAGASAIGLLSLGEDTPEAWLAGGRAMQRTWLRAELLDLGLHPMMFALYMFDLLDGPPARLFSADEVSTLRDLKNRFLQATMPTRGPIAFLFRLSRITAPAEQSLRLPAEWVLSAGLPPRNVTTTVVDACVDRCPRRPWAPAGHGPAPGPTTGGGHRENYRVSGAGTP